MRIEILECEREVAKEKLTNIIKNIFNDEIDKQLDYHKQIMLKPTQDIFYKDRCVDSLTSLICDSNNIQILFKDDKKIKEFVRNNSHFPLSFLSDLADALIEGNYEVYVAD